MVSYFSIQVNSQLDILVQSVIKIIVSGAKHTFEKLRMQSIIGV